MAEGPGVPHGCETPLNALAACSGLMGSVRSSLATLPAEVPGQASLEMELCVATAGFVVDGCRAAEALGREGLWVYAASAITIPYEASVRLLWASRVKDGPQRLRVGWHHERLKWAKRALNGAHGEHARAVLEDTQRVEGQWRKGLYSTKPPPNLRDMLHEIDLADDTSATRASRHAARNDHDAGFHLMFILATHGFPSALRGLPGLDVCGHVAVAAAMATRMTLRAHEHFFPDVQPEWKPPAQAAFQKIWASLEHYGVDAGPAPARS